jgi:hypothetical protein
MPFGSDQSSNFPAIICHPVASQPVLSIALSKENQGVTPELV